MSYVRFIIPTIGRKTLANTIASLYEQNCDDWDATVIFDDVNPTIQSNYHLHVIRTPKKLGVGVNGAGAVRNYGLSYRISNRKPMWYAFVDDDDTLAYKYVENLIEETANLNLAPDIVIFSMQHPALGILPPTTKLLVKELENQVGISFAVRPHVFDKVKFSPSSGEDFQFLKKADEAGFKIVISDYIGYYVSPLGTAEDRT